MARENRGRAGVSNGSTAEGNRAIGTPIRVPAEGYDLLSLVRASLDDDKAEDVVVIDLVGKTSIADHMVIATGTSQRHVGTMAEHLRERLKARGVRKVSSEGEAHCDWVLIDAGDVIVHLFRAEVRAFYALEKMWGTPRAAQAGLRA